MIDAGAINATTEQPAHEKGGFPPFKTETFPSQIFWLAITFAFLFVVLWRIAGPRISSVIGMRRDKINGDIAAAQKSRGDAEAASAAYQTALAAARARAQTLAEENRKRLAADIDKAKADAETQAHDATAKAEDRIQSMREQAKASVANAARDAAIEIVARLTGGSVSAEEAAAAVKSASGG